MAYSSSLSTVRLDLADASTWPRALTRVSRVFLAVPARVLDAGTPLRSFLDTAGSAGVDHVVFLSSAGAQQGTPHWQVEAEIDAAGMPRTFLRPATLHQHLADACGDDIAKHDRLRLPDGSSRIAYVDARDVARVAAITLLSDSPAPRSSYTLTGRDVLSGTEVAALLSRVLGRDISFEPVAPVRSPTALTASARVQSRGATDPTLQQLLGRTPTSLADFAREHRARWVTPVG
jgi:uncharacterized protein YbjT (DUF2867 family)